MDKKSQILIVILFSAILVSAYLSYDRVIVRKDFEITQSETDTTESGTTVTTISNDSTSIDPIYSKNQHRRKQFSKHQQLLLAICEYRFP